jgi:dipeptidyl aminopeptidase/acylaminoacyl peptidase
LTVNDNAQPTPPAPSEAPPLIPRELLFGNPERVQSRLSPDGKRLSYLAPRDGVLNVWLRSLARDDERPLTAEKPRGVHWHTWAYDNRHVLYRQDKDGDENWHIYALDVEDGTTRDLTPHDGIQASIVALDPKFPDSVLVSMNRRDKRLMDLYRIDLETGATDLVAENPGNVVGWLPDHDFRARAAQAAAADGGFDLLVRLSDDEPFEIALHWTPDDDGTAYGFTPDGNAIYIGDSSGTETVVFKVYDIATGKQHTLASDDRTDVDEVVINPLTHAAEAVAFCYDRRRWLALEPDVREDLAAIIESLRGDFSIVSRDVAGDTWLLAVTNDSQPDSYYRYSRRTHTVEHLFSTKPELTQHTLGDLQFVDIPARDGLSLPCYLALPPGSVREKLPLVLNVHGGPWHRDRWEFRADVQWLTNRGYAVLLVNFRGSTGFGKSFLHAADKEWGRKMQNDLTDAVGWAVDSGYADPDRIAIYGGSYGGYAALAGAAFTPDLYCCAISIVGPSSILTWMDAIPPYWEPMREMIHTRVGDPETDLDMLKARSPLYAVDRIRIPMLIGQGANDPRVKKEESDRMVAALRDRGLEVEYVVYPDEGHGCARPENRLDFYARAEWFLARHLGGHAEP